ncbi:MAG: PQQ-binding-like beta-propeller repeat protein [Pseudomonadales bacterium]
MQQRRTMSFMRHGRILTTSWIVAALILSGFARAAESAATASPTPDDAGAELFARACGNCHLGQVAKAPHLTMLQIMTADSILAAMESGVMRQQSASLQSNERRAIASYLSGAAPGDRHDVSPLAHCAAGTAPAFDPAAPPFASGWGIDPGNQRQIPTEIAGLVAADLPNLELKWVFAFPDALRVRSAPTLAGGWLYVGAHNGDVHALDPSRGCVIWTFKAAAEIRTGIVVSSWTPGDKQARPLAFFGDLLGNVYAIDAVTGQSIWRQKAHEHPNATITGTPSLAGDRLYVPVSSLEVVPAAMPDYPCCSFRGAVVAYAAASGEKLWQTDTIPEPPVQRGLNASGTPQFGPSGAPIWNSPAIDTQRGQLYVGTGENYSSPATGTSDAIIAIALDTGAIRWVFQATPGDAWNTACDQPNDDNCPDEDGPDFDFAAGTILARGSDGRDYVIAGQKSGVVHGIDPDTGVLRWQTRAGRGGIQGGVHFGMAVSGYRVIVPINDMQDGRTYPHPAEPGIHALDIATGAIDWRHVLRGETCGDKLFCNAGISAAITATPDFVLAGGMDGVLRAHAVSDGRLLWSYETARPFEAPGGVPAQGGSFGGGAAPLIANGMIFASSGYGIYQHMPGNVLLAFGKRAQAANASSENQ